MPVASKKRKEPPTTAEQRQRLALTAKLATRFTAASEPDADTELHVGEPRTVLLAHSIVLKRVSPLLSTAVSGPTEATGRHVFPLAAFTADTVRRVLATVYPPVLPAVDTILGPDDSQAPQLLACLRLAHYLQLTEVLTAIRTELERREGRYHSQALFELISAFEEATHGTGTEAWAPSVVRFMARQLRTRRPVAHADTQHVAVWSKPLLRGVLIELADTAESPTSSDEAESDYE